MIYEWKPKAQIKADPQLVGERMEQIRHEHGGFFNREVVLIEASETESPLHPCFEWDNAKAAHAYRLDQANHLISSLIVIMEKPNEEAPTHVRAFVHVQIEDKPEARFTSIGDAMGDPILRQQVVQQAWKDLEQWRKKYQDYNELAAVFSVIEQQAVAA